MNSISGKYYINGYPIHFDTFGGGSEVILLISGSLGSPKYDFRPQIEGPNAFDLSKYTIVGIDLPGWGRSRPPKRMYGPKVNEIDIDCCMKVMDKLGFKTFSVIGWSEGAKIALAMSYFHPNRVKCCVCIAIFVFMSKQSLSPILYTRDTKLWPKKQIDDFLQIYGNRETVQQLWDEHIHVIKKLMDECDPNQGHYLVKPEELRQIKAPVLLIHGNKDPMIGVEHSIYCNENLSTSILHRIPNGSHNCHQVFADQFKRIVEDFIDNSNISSFE